MIDQTELTYVPTNSTDLPPERYDRTRLSVFQALKDLCARVRSGEITPENEDGILSVLAESKAEDQHIIDKSLYDPLLGEEGFYAVNHFNSHLQEALAIISNNPQPRKEGGSFHGATLLRIDLDDFSNANNIHGHPFGDKVLKTVARIINTYVKRRQDFVGRTPEKKTATQKNEGGETGRPGGDELDVLLYDTDTKGAIALTEKIRTHLEEAPIKAPDGADWRQGISVGIYTLEPGITVKEAINRVDTALYHAKANGKNCVSVWKEGMTMPQKQLAAV